MESDGEKVVGRIERRYACDVSGLRERNRHRVVAAHRSEVDPARPRHMDERAPPACDFPGDGGVTAGVPDQLFAGDLTPVLMESVAVYPSRSRRLAVGVHDHLPDTTALILAMCCPHRSP